MFVVSGFVLFPVLLAHKTENSAEAETTLKHRSEHKTSEFAVLPFLPSATFVELCMLYANVLTKNYVCFF